MAKKAGHTGRKMAFGAALAGVTGYLAGILTAPKSGKKTREDISDRAAGIKDSASADLQILEVELKDLLDRSKSKTIALSSQAREEFNEAVIKARDAQNKAGYALKAIKLGEADDPQLNKAIKQAKQAKKNLGKFLKS